MKLICTQENFKKAIFDTERVTGKQKTLPILNNILLEVEKGRINFSATNLEIGVISKIGAKIEEEGRITVPAKILSNFVNNLPENDTLEISGDDENLAIKSGDYEAKIRGLSAQDFPIIPKMSSGKYLFSLPAKEFKEALSKILVCVSSNEIRPELAGINMLLSEKEIVFAGTDSFRLAESVINLIQESGEEYSGLLSKTGSVIVPIGTFSEITRIINPETEKVRVSIEDGQIFFEVDNVEVVSRLINGKYPEYRQIIPETFATRAVLKCSELSRAIRLASVFSGDKSSGEVKVKIDSEAGEIVISSESQETGENHGSFKADIVGPSQEVIFNPRYILDGINSVATSQMAFLANSGSSPVAIRLIDEGKGTVLDKYTYIVMPIKNK